MQDLGYELPGSGVLRRWLHRAKGLSILLSFSPLFPKFFNARIERLLAHSSLLFDGQLD